MKSPTERALPNGLTMLCANHDTIFNTVKEKALTLPELYDARTIAPYVKKILSLTATSQYFGPYNGKSVLMTSHGIGLYSEFAQLGDITQRTRRIGSPYINKLSHDEAVVLLDQSITVKEYLKDPRARDVVIRMVKPQLSSIHKNAGMVSRSALLKDELFLVRVGGEERAVSIIDALVKNRQTQFQNGSMLEYDDREEDVRCGLGGKDYYAEQLHASPSGILPDSLNARRRGCCIYRK